MCSVSMEKVAVQLSQPLPVRQTNDVPNQLEWRFASATCASEAQPHQASKL